MFFVFNEHIFSACPNTLVLNAGARVTMQEDASQFGVLSVVMFVSHE